MSMCTSVVGFRDPDDKKLKAMLDLKKACEEAKINYPIELKEYFKNYEQEDETYLRDMCLEVDISHAIVKNSSRDACDDIYVDISELPSECKIIRFTNSW